MAANGCEPKGDSGVLIIFYFLLLGECCIENSFVLLVKLCIHVCAFFSVYMMYFTGSDVF
jgi:hypothetical protein